MIKNKGFKFSFSVSLLIAMLFHLVILFFVKKSTIDFASLNRASFPSTQPIKINHIELIKPEELERIKRVGIKIGLKKD